MHISEGRQWHDFTCTANKFMHLHNLGNYALCRGGWNIKINIAKVNKALK